MDDDALLRRCQHGDADALRELLLRYQGPLFRLACRVLGDPARAEDATADALARVWQRCMQWRGDAPAGVWIYRLALRTVLDGRRRRARWWRFGSAPPVDQADPRPDPAELAADAEQRRHRADRVREVLAGLSDEERALVHLHYFEQRPLAEIALVLGASRDALKMRLARLRQRLRPLLEDDHADRPD